MNSVNFKNDLHYPFRVLSDLPTMASQGEEGLGGLSPTPKYPMTCQFWGFQEWKFQNSPFLFKGTLRHLLSRY